MSNIDFLKTAARAVEIQVVENPSLGIPVDPEVAEYMGAFEDDPAALDVIADDADGGEHGRE